MQRRGVTPVNPPRHVQQQPREPHRRVLAKDTRNLGPGCQGKISVTGSSSMNKLNVGEEGRVRNCTRNNSQKVLRAENQTRKTEESNGSSGKQRRSIGESTTASPQSTTVRDYLVSRAPRASSQISSQLPINLQMRELVVSWIMELCHKMPLKSDTLFHCIQMLDQILANYRTSNLSGMMICMQNLQLLALTCLFISAKYEQIYPPTADLFVKVGDYTYSKRKIIDMEASILLEQQFNLTFPTRFVFLSQLLHEESYLPTNKTKRLEHLCLLLLEISLLQLWQQATEEQLAQASLFLGKKITGIAAGTPKRKTCHLAWKLMSIWRKRRNSILCYIFDTDRYSFVGGLCLEEI